MQAVLASSHAIEIVAGGARHDEDDVLLKLTRWAHEQRRHDHDQTKRRTCTCHPKTTHFCKLPCMHAPAAARAHTTTPRRPAKSWPAPLARDRDMPVAAAASPSPLVTLLQRMGYQRSDRARRPAGTAAAQRRPRACAPACQPERTDGAHPALHAHETLPCGLAGRPPFKYRRS
jgi:hypothetical protein